MVKYVVRGAGGHAKLLLDNFEGIEDFVEVFLDSHSDEERLGNIPIMRPELWENYKDYKVVICVKNQFHEIYNELIYKYRCEKQNIFSSHEWICNLLAERRVKLHPKCIRLETSTLCQLDCPYCCMRTGNSGVLGGGYLKYEDFTAFHGKNPYINKIEISNYGEPFLNPDLGKILLYCGEKNIEVTIGNGTNFNTVSDEILELLVKTQVSFINISIDGATQEIYGIYRRKGDFSKVISNIKKLNEYKKKHNSSLPRLQWQYILMPHNECDVEKASLMAKELGMDIFYKYECEKGKFEPKDRKKLEKITGLECFSLEEYNKKHNNVYGAEYCNEILFSPQINYDGRLLGCCMPWNEDFGVNVFKEGLVNALNSAKYLKMIYALLGMTQTHGYMKGLPCLQCQHCGHCSEDYRKRNYFYL